MANPSISIPDEMLAEVDERLGYGDSRSAYIREALRKRLDEEDAGEWQPPGTDGSDPAEA
jgi:metal-responsive CopG/Arc/MetJ family transcriptional regulator